MVMLAAAESGLTSGRHAFIAMETHQGYPDLHRWNRYHNDYYNHSGVAVDLIDALLVFVAQPYSRIDHFLDNSTQLDDNVDRNMYNAIQMIAGALTLYANKSENATDDEIVHYLQDMTFMGYGSPCRTSSKADIVSYFTMMDYNKGFLQWLPVTEYTPAEVVNRNPDVAITYPNGVVIQPDPCVWNPDSCKYKFPTEGIAAVILVIALITTVSAIIARIIRTRITNQQMSKGPNKLILTQDDLIFVSPKSLRKNSKSLKSNPMFDKPDLLKASEPSLSISSGHTDAEMHSRTARYKGDLVFVKTLDIKNYEVKTKAVHLLKQMRELRHENVNAFVGYFSDPMRPSLIMEYCQRQSLEDILSNESIALDWDFKLSLLTDLVKGIRYLHASPIKCHGNLKSGNCVVDSRWVLKITDFGLDSVLQQYQSPRKLVDKELLWTAPELLRDELLLRNQHPKGDVFSFAIILQEVIVRGHPYCMLEIGPEEIIKKVRKPPPLCRPSVSAAAAPPQYIQMMKQCWAEIPDMRPDFDQIYQQFKEINKGKKLNIVDTMFKMLESYSNNLEEVVQERTDQLEEEKKKTEHLLSQMLPGPVAKSLLTGQRVEAETFQVVTIYFSDIVGFTTISALSTPLQVVDLLNDLYTVFDSTIDNYDVYKVETIGDAYMVVSGLPERNGDRHAGEIASMSLDLLSLCGIFRIRHMPDVPLKLRIGLHTGPCVAGVVGLRMPRYCLFGDTVNTASRMESTGLAYRIHVSPVTKDILDILGGYELDCRGEVELKGKGRVVSWWLTGREGFDKPMPEPAPEAVEGLAAALGEEKFKQLQQRMQENSNPDQADESDPSQTTTGSKNSDASLSKIDPTTEDASVDSPQQTTESSTGDKELGDIPEENSAPAEEQSKSPNKDAPCESTEGPSNPQSGGVTPTLPNQVASPS